MAQKSEEKKGFFKKKRIKQIAVIAFVIFNILIIYWTASKELSRDKTEGAGELRLQVWLLIPAIVAFLGAIFSDFYKYYILIRRFTKKKDFKLAVETILIGRYYDNITPSAIGGQPFQIVHMRKRGHIEKEYADMIPIIGFVSSMVAFIFLSLLVIIFGRSIVISDVIYAASHFGILLYSFAPSLILFFTFKPKAAKKLSSGFIRFLHKLHIVKSVEHAEEKAFGQIEKYASCIRRVVKDKKFLFRVMGLSILYQLLLYSIPFLVVTAFGGSIDYLAAIMTAISIQTAISFIPTPGNAGAAEGSFYLVFASLGSGDTFWAMFTWRFFSYYIFIIMGALLYLKLGIEKRKHNSSAVSSANSTNKAQ